MDSPSTGGGGGGLDMQEGHRNARLHFVYFDTAQTMDREYLRKWWKGESVVIQKAVIQLVNIIVQSMRGEGKRFCKKIE